MKVSYQAMEKYDIIIVGAGIAGLTAGIYSSRQKLSTLIIGKNLGGQLLQTPEIQNYPGFLSISGLELIKKVERQVRTFNAKIVFDEVIKIEKESSIFAVTTISHGTFRSDALILAFGKTPKNLGVPGEDELKGKGISYCTICDAFLFKNKVVALIGEGDQALEGVYLLNKIARKVYWIFPGMRTPFDINSLLNENKIKITPNSKIVKIIGKDKIESIIVKNLKENAIKEYKVEGLFIEIGYTTNTGIIKKLVKLNEKGEIIIDKYCKTSTEGIFAAGDITDIAYKQAIISAGQGAIAALSAYAYIMKKRGKRAKLLDWRHENLGKEKSGIFLKI